MSRARWAVRKTFGPEWMAVDRMRLSYTLHPSWAEAFRVAYDHARGEDS